MNNNYDWDTEDEIYVMEEPWYFTMVFDEAKSQADGWTVEELYDMVDDYACKWGNRRIGLNTWQAIDKKEEFTAVGGAIVHMSEWNWVMDHISQWTVYDDDAPDGADYLKEIARVPFATTGPSKKQDF